VCCHLAAVVWSTYTTVVYTTVVSITSAKKYGGWWWALVSLHGVVPSRVVGVSASVNLPLHHKVQKFSSGTGLPGWSWKKGRKTVVLVVVIYCVYFCIRMLI